MPIICVAADLPFVPGDVRDGPEHLAGGVLVRVDVRVPQAQLSRPLLDLDAAADELAALLGVGVLQREGVDAAVGDAALAGGALDVLEASPHGQQLHQLALLDGQPARVAHPHVVQRLATE
eukprot:scaffold493362_cov38-Prasinocladus_malaysianus.AAC.1